MTSTAASDFALLDEAFKSVKNLPETWQTNSRFLKTDDDGNVAEIDLRQLNLHGSVDLTKLPPKLKTLYLNGNSLSGSVDLTRLPSSLEILALSNNPFVKGSVDLTRLPSSLKGLHMTTCKLSGRLDVRHLPPSLKELTLGYNSLTSIEGRDNLPASLKVLDISHNKLRGVILKPASVRQFTAYNQNLVIYNKKKEYDMCYAFPVGAVRELRTAFSSRCNAHEAFKIYNVAQQTINFLVSGVSVD